MKQTLTELEREIDESTIIIEDINTPVSEIDKLSRQKISKDSTELNIIDQLNIVAIYRLLFHPKTTKYTFFSRFHGTFTKINHTLGYKHT